MSTPQSRSTLIAAALYDLGQLEDCEPHWAPLLAKARQALQDYQTLADDLHTLWRIIAPKLPAAPVDHGDDPMLDFQPEDAEEERS
jgi:hypothetical protein